MWCHDLRASILIIVFFGVSSQLAVQANATPLSLPQTVNINTPTTQPSPTCDALLDIIDSYGTLEGTLGGAQILMPNLGEASTIVRQFMTLLDSATLNVWALFDALSCKRYQAPVGDEGDGVVPALAFISQMHRVKRQTAGSSTVVCTALEKVSADVAQTVTLMSRLTGAKGLPAQLYLDPLQEAVNDAQVRIEVVETALKASSGC
ncbi:hypothetical protein V8F20_005352 [Naviculisporaceae sp. PSN 640]